MTAEQTTRPESENFDRLWTGAKDSPPIVWLARLGAVFVVFQAYVYLRWIFSDAFTPSPNGPDAIPGATIAWIRFWEIGCLVLGVGLFWFIIAKMRRERQFPTLGVFVFAWLLAAWQDVGVNAVRPVFGYSGGFFNMGTWGEFIPGWVEKGPENPQPIIYFLASYIVLTPLAIMGIDKLIETVRKRFPRINKAGVIAFMIALFSVLCIVAEQFFHRIGAWHYLRVNEDWAIFPGTMHQFPLYEGIFFGGVVTVLSIGIYCFRDDNAMMLTDRGIEQIRHTRWLPVVRILALTAVFNLIMMVFMLGFNFVNQHADVQPAEDVPSYVHHGMCGIDPNPPCPPPA
ncbi:spirocyclase AveC family protein [Mycobacterium sp. ITM-2016-00317]|uniref:spirocyclase AveC family protein n=1 Tax=Mycobacterium sp. ITM-2016-00317 TaxID=2099694 RepID=UPI00287F418D|nr:spirocyclase AveC family protein [Mycobacterium sp. ITM-2016-00317]WNG89275.1 spirocyclase AveC family protein [Mycobacterium sp. ITM-2016-00317]